MNFRNLASLSTLLFAHVPFLVFVTPAPSARADYLATAGVGSWELRPQKAGILSIEPRFFLMNSNSNFDPTGTAAAVTDLNAWSRIQGEAAVRYGISERVSLLGKMTWSLVQTDHATATYSGTAFGFGDQTVGLSYRAYQSRGTSLRPHENLRVDLVLLGDIPTYTNPIAAANQPPFLGNGSFDLTFSPLLTWTFSGTETEATQLIGSFGYTYRSGGYSMHLPWTVGIRREVTNGTGFQFSTLARGTISMRNDERTLLGDTLGPANGAGGSAAINAINPMLVEAQVQAGFRLAPTFAIAGFGHFPLYGQNIPAGLRLGAQLSIDFGHSQRKRPDQLSNKDYERGNQGFVTYGLEAKVLRANDRLNLVKIDKGANDGVEQGQHFDIFPILQNGKTGEAIARAQVTAVRAQESALSVTEYYREVLIDEGFVARLAMP
jgi:hypothetical protein